MTLRISGSLNHDGDGLVRYEVSVNSACFAARTLCWGNAEELLVLAERLTLFPLDVGASVQFSFGTEKSGSCGLEFITLNSQGHCGVWVSISAEDRAYSGQRFEKAEIFMRIEPASIDKFVAGLRTFYSGESSEALLGGAES